MSGQYLACELNATDFARRAESYVRAAGRYTGTARIEGNIARIDLHGDKSQIAAQLDEMIANEASCCAHLQFEVDEVEDGYRVALSVPGTTGIEQPILIEALSILFPTTPLAPTSGDDAGQRALDRSGLPPR